MNTFEKTVQLPSNGLFGGPKEITLRAMTTKEEKIILSSRDFSVFENIYNEKTLKAAEKMFHTHIYACVQHCICRLPADSVHYNMSDLLEECIALMEKEKEIIYKGLSVSGILNHIQLKKQTKQF